MTTEIQEALEPWDEKHRSPLVLVAQFKVLQAEVRRLRAACEEGLVNERKAAEKMQRALVEKEAAEAKLKAFEVLNDPDKMSWKLEWERQFDLRQAAERQSAEWKMAAEAAQEDVQVWRNRTKEAIEYMHDAEKERDTANSVIRDLEKISERIKAETMEELEPLRRIFYRLKRMLDPEQSCMGRLADLKQDVDAFAAGKERDKCIEERQNEWLTELRARADAAEAENARLVGQLERERDRLQNVRQMQDDRPDVLAGVIREREALQAKLDAAMEVVRSATGLFSDMVIRHKLKCGCDPLADDLSSTTGCLWALRAEKELAQIAALNSAKTGGA